MADQCRTRPLREHQGFAGIAGDLSLADARSAGWTLFDLESPVATVDRGRLRRNIELMGSWCSAHGVSLAPHVKTTMSPEIIEIQRDTGVWGFTVATAQQLRSLRTLELPKVIVASELVSRTAAAYVLEQNRSTDILVFVDSVDGVDLLAEAAQATRSRPLGVLLEVGASGGRSGVRSTAAGLDVAMAVARSHALELRGVSGFEGILGRDRSAAAQHDITAYLKSIGALATRLHEFGHFDTAERPPIVSAGGSAYFDLAVDALCGLGMELVLRSGCYVTHDSGLYSRVSPLRTAASDAALEAALHVWAQVISTPETGVYVLNAGRREISTDVEPPRVELVVPGSHRHGLAVRDPDVLRVSDHHTVVCFDEPRLAIGDWVQLGVSHPCTTFDKWPLLALVEGDAVVDVVHTHF